MNDLSLKTFLIESRKFSEPDAAAEAERLLNGPLPEEERDYKIDLGIEFILWRTKRQAKQRL
jgi:hypothetical protein